MVMVRLPVFDVRNYGATGDGVTDDTTAIQKCIADANAAAPSVVEFPRGTYMVGDSGVGASGSRLFTFSSNDVTVRGHGCVFKITANGVSQSVFYITANRVKIYDVTVDCNAGVALSTKSNSGFEINGTVITDGGCDNLIFGCKVINGIKASPDQTEECFVIIQGKRNRIENCWASGTAWQAFRVAGDHNYITNCSAYDHRGNGIRVLAGESVFIDGFVSWSERNEGRHSILIDPGSSNDAQTPENDVDRRIDYAVIRNCYCFGNDNASAVNVIKIASVRECLIDGCYVEAGNAASNVAISLEDSIDQCTIKNCYIFPNIYVRPTGEATTSSVFQGPLGSTVSSTSLDLDLDASGSGDGADNYVTYTVSRHGFSGGLGKTIYVRGSSVANYNGPQQIVATTATTITTNRKYSSASIGSNAYAHSGCDKVDIIDCTFENDQDEYNYNIENLASPSVNIQGCTFKNLTANTVKQSCINTAYRSDKAIANLRIVNNKFYHRTTNIVRAIRHTNITEVQSYTINGSPTGGTYTLTHNGNTTGSIAYNASAATVQTALRLLSGLGSVTVALSGSTYTVTFTGVSGNTPQMTSTSSLTGGTAPSITHATIIEGAAPPALLTSGKIICYGNEVFNDRVSSNIQLVDMYNAADSVSTALADRALLFATDGENPRRFRGTAPPTLGTFTWSAGDFVVNSEPSAGEPYGWLCTVGGSPGTWQAVGANGTLHVNVDEVGTVLTGEDDLLSYTLPANSLEASGESLEIEAGFTFANNTNTKQVKFYIGSNQLYASGASAHQSGAMVFRALVVRDQSNTAKVSVTVYANGSNVPFATAYGNAFAQGTIDWTGTLTIKGTGETNGTSGGGTNDIVMQFLRVRKLPAP